MKLRCLTLAAVLLAGARLDAQQWFGQNQVQYKHFDWRIIETEHFLVHYYPEERAGAMDAARMAERSYARLSRILNHQFREKKPIILFDSRSTFGQNNVIGDPGEGVGGVTEGLRHRLIMPFTGDLGSFERVLAHEMVHEFQYDIFARGKAGAGLQTMSQVNPPLWFMEGMAEYLAIGPVHPLTESWLRDAAVNGTVPTIEQMTERPDRYFPYRYGESLWQYVGDRWGDAAIGEILNNATTLGIARAFQRQLGLTLHELSDDWREAINAKYLPQAAQLDRPRTFAQPLLTPRRSGGQIFLAPALSNDGNLIAFLSNGEETRGEVFIDLWLADARTGKRIKRLIESTTNPNFEELRLLYSQSSFSNNGRTLAFTAQRKGKDVLYLLDVATRKVRSLDLPVDAVTNPVWSPDDAQLAFSGTRGGISDLFIVDVNGKNLRQLTNDEYGDLQPAWSPDGQRIAFASDRGPETSLAVLQLAKWRISVYDLRSGAIEVLPNQGGLNLNPVWSPDGRELGFISDRTGIPNIFLYDFSNREHYQITNVLGGISAITEYSPALTWARRADKVAFVYYERGDYTVWTFDNPRARKTVAYRAAGTERVAAATQADTSRARLDSLTLRPRSGEPTSTYRSPSGTRQSSVLLPTETVEAAPASVAALNADPTFALPDTTRFKEYPYRISFHPDYIADPSVGYTPNYGNFSGGTAFVFSDLLGNHQIAVSANIYGKISDASFFVGYANLSRRLQYTMGVSQDPIYVPLTFGCQQFGTIIRCSEDYLRYVIRNLFVIGQYPFNRFTRFETGVQFNSIGQGLVRVFQDCNTAGFCDQVQQDNVEDRPTITYFTPNVAFVSDNTLFGTTAPISGRRMRFQVAQTVGELVFTDYVADYRRYDPIVFNRLTFATRFLASVSVGQDETFFQKYIGRPDYVRGYDRANFNSFDCTSTIGEGQAECNNTQLAGSRVAVANAELRFPIIRRFDIGSSFGLPPVDGLLFYDAGLAWSKGQQAFLKKPDNFDPNTQRFPLRSWGAGLRVNLFNLAILRWDYARPLDIDRDPNWTFSLGASF
ncbi:MAG TPA: BamA/TamA family outer membrane protein [Gemmatimonadaceae bacterium]|nr:BamA/TamA family outer membrane protein [Gemmatimonadaceae bacterium]